MSIYLRINLYKLIMSKKNNYNISNDSNIPIINELDLLVKEIQYKISFPSFVNIWNIIIMFY